MEHTAFSINGPQAGIICFRVLFSGSKGQISLSYDHISLIIQDIKKRLYIYRSNHKRDKRQTLNGLITVGIVMRRGAGDTGGRNRLRKTDDRLRLRRRRSLIISHSLKRPVVIVRRRQRRLLGGAGGGAGSASALPSSFFAHDSGINRSIDRSINQRRGSGIGDRKRRLY